MSIKSATITNQKTKTPKDIVAEANEIWSKCAVAFNKFRRDSGRPVLKKSPELTDKDNKFLDEYFDDVAKEHRDFQTAYPTVLRHMIQELRYDAAVFLRYLEHLEKNPWKSDTERIESYAEYITMLMEAAYRGVGRRLTVTELTQFRRDYVARLTEEERITRTRIEEFAKEEEAKQSTYEKMERASLVSSLKRIIADYKEMVKENEVEMLGVAELEKTYMIIADLVEKNMMRTDTLRDAVYAVRKRLADRNVIVN